MQRYFLQKEDFINDRISGDDFHHIKNVLRMKTKDEFYVVYAKKCYLVQISYFDENCVHYTIIEEIHTQRELPVQVTLIMGLPKSDKLEFIIEKTTELGVAEILPVRMQRSIMKIDPSKISTKLKRYQKIAKEAAEQSHRSSIPEILDIKDSLKQIHYDRFQYKFVCYEENLVSNQFHLSEALSNIPENSSICFIIGPEGGITQEEYAFLKNNGFESIALGPRILRCETAPLYFMSAVSFYTEGIKHE